MIRSPGRRPFNNKTRSYGSRSRSHPRSRPTPRPSLSLYIYLYMCACVCARVRKRINFSRAFMLSDRPNSTHTHTRTRFPHSAVVPHLHDVSTFRRVRERRGNTHTLRNVRGRGVRMYVRLRKYGLTTRPRVHLPTCRRKIITTSEISKYTYAKCAPGEPYNTMIKHGRKGAGDPRNRFSIPSKRIFSFFSCYCWKNYLPLVHPPS